MSSSGALGGAYEVTRESAAESIVRQALGAFDFTKVIEAAYADGVRVFVEVGPGTTLSGLIRKTVPAARMVHVQDPESLHEACAALEVSPSDVA